MAKKKVLEKKTEFQVVSAGDGVRELLANEGMTIEELAGKMGQTRQNISQQINRVKSMRFENFQKIVAALGYEIIVKKIS